MPKVDAATMAPVVWPTNPQQEWCPPGHGDLYAALDGSGTLDRLLADGVKYMFVSNSDNLGESPGASGFPVRFLGPLAFPRVNRGADSRPAS